MSQNNNKTELETVIEPAKDTMTKIDNFIDLGHGKNSILDENMVRLEDLHYLAQAQPRPSSNYENYENVLVNDSLSQTTEMHIKSEVTDQNTNIIERDSANLISESSLNDNLSDVSQDYPTLAVIQPNLDEKSQTTSITSQTNSNHDKAMTFFTVVIVSFLSIICIILIYHFCSGMIYELKSRKNISDSKNRKKKKNSNRTHQQMLDDEYNLEISRQKEDMLSSVHSAYDFKMELK